MPRVSARLALGQIDRLRDAGATYRAALKIKAQTEMSRCWAAQAISCCAALANAQAEPSLEESKRSPPIARPSCNLRETWFRRSGGLGEHETGTRSLKQALTAWRAALEERSRGQSPNQWARTQVNIGLTLLTLSKRGGGKAAEKSIAAFKQALSVFQEANARRGVARVANLLAEAHALKK